MHVVSVKVLFLRLRSTGLKNAISSGLRSGLLGRNRNHAAYCEDRLGPRAHVAGRAADEEPRLINGLVAVIFWFEERIDFAAAPLSAKCCARAAKMTQPSEL